jgi:hypothetical protein
MPASLWAAVAQVHQNRRHEGLARRTLEVARRSKSAARVSGLNIGCP